MWFACRATQQSKFSGLFEGLMDVWDGTVSPIFTENLARAHDCVVHHKNRSNLGLKCLQSLKNARNKKSVFR